MCEVPFVFFQLQFRYVASVTPGVYDPQTSKMRFRYVVCTIVVTPFHIELENTYAQTLHTRRYTLNTFDTTHPILY